MRGPGEVWKKEEALEKLTERAEQFHQIATSGKHPKWATYFETISGEKFRQAMVDARLAISAGKAP